MWSEYDFIFKRLKNNEQGRYSITRPYEGRQIVQYINMITMSKLGTLLSDCIVTDCTAGVGGDSINFSYVAKHVNAIEQDIGQYELLEENCKISARDNITTVHGNCMDYIGNFANHVIYIDPPWGGLGYKTHGNLQLSLGGYGLDFIANYMKRYGIVFMKLPLNADLTNIPIENKFLINNKKNTPSFYLIHISQGLIYNQTPSLKNSEYFSDIPKGWNCP